MFLYQRRVQPCLGLEGPSTHLPTGKKAGLRNHVPDLGDEHVPMGIVHVEEKTQTNDSSRAR